MSESVCEWVIEWDSVWIINFYISIILSSDNAKNHPIKRFRSALIISTLWLSSTEVILIGVKNYFPDYYSCPWFEYVSRREYAHSSNASKQPQ